MTPSQLTHLRAIDARLEHLLQIASKRSPGRWLHNPGSEQVIKAENSRPLDAIIWTGDIGGFAEAEDGNYVAACSNNAEAGWQATRDIIKESLYLRSDAPGELGSILQIILAQWPLETLNQQPYDLH